MMGRSPSSSDENGVKKGPWTPEEDQRLIDHIEKHGHGSWRALPKLAGLNRCGKSCRLRWTNYLRPDIKRGKFSEEEEQIIISLHEVLGNKWSAIATRLPGRTDNEIKNFWNTHLRKKLLQMGIDPITHRPRTDHLNLYANLSQLLGNNSWDNALMSTLQTNPTQLAKLQLLQNILQVLSSNTNPSPTMEALNLLGIAPQFRDNQHRVSEYLRLINSQHDLGALNPNQFLSNFPLLDVHHQHQHGYGGVIQPMAHSEAFGAIDDDLRVENTLPGLVSASPDQSSNVNHHQMESKINTSDITNPPTTFEANWSGQLVDDEAGESYWRDIIEQATSPTWPIS